MGCPAALRQCLLVFQLPRPSFSLWCPLLTPHPPASYPPFPRPCDINFAISVALIASRKQRTLWITFASFIPNFSPQHPRRAPWSTPPRSSQVARSSSSSTEASPLGSTSRPTTPTIRRMAGRLASDGEVGISLLQTFESFRLTSLSLHQWHLWLSSCPTRALVGQRRGIRIELKALMASPPTQSMLRPTVLPQRGL